MEQGCQLVSWVQNKKWTRSSFLKSTQETTAFLQFYSIEKMMQNDLIFSILAKSSRLLQLTQKRIK